MDKRTTNAASEILSKLKKSKGTVINAFLGFDACIDSIVRVVKDDKEETGSGYYNNSRHFAEFLINHENISCTIELNTKLSKPGGNMVITSNALGNLGVKADCIGTFGLPEILPAFRSISENCTLYSISDTITATALEFNDSKVILFDPGPYDHLSWQGIKDLLGVALIKKLLSGKQLILFLNWSEIAHSTQIWQGILEDILPLIKGKSEKQYFFADLSDCSRKSDKEIHEVIKLLSRFRKYFTVGISFNQNEADLIAKAFSIHDYTSDDEFIRMLFRKIDVDRLVIHRMSDALAFDGTEFEKCETFFCKEPAILTGGGDNFNAGFCFAQITGLDLFQSLLFANAVSGYYVKNAKSPDIQNLSEFLKHNCC